MPEGFACGIRNHGLWNRNSTKEIRNPANDWNLDSSSTDKEFGIHSGESRIQDCLGLPYMVLHGATCWETYNSKTFILKRSMVSSQLYPQFLVSLWASSPGRSGSGARKGRRTCNYLSGIWTFALVSASRRLAEIWQLSRRRAKRELEVEFKFQRRSCKLSFLFQPHREIRAPWRACS